MKISLPLQKYPCTIEIPPLKLGFNTYVGTKVSWFSYSSTLPHTMLTLIFKIKNIKPPLSVSTKFVVLGYFFFCSRKWTSNHGKWCHHVFKSSSHASMRWKLEEAPLDVNVSQRLCEEEPIGRVVCTEWLNSYEIIKCRLTLVLLSSI